MPTGFVVALFTAPAKGAPMQRVRSARAVPGRGLEGDRYFAGQGAFSRWPGPRREFIIGDVRMRGMRLCQPCAYLERLTGRDGLLKAMVGRGDLRARILSEGTLRPGHTVRLGHALD